MSHSLVLVVFDSCRYDTFVEASPAAIASLGAIERRYSYASWTAPSHYNLLMGLMPHTSPTGVFASDVYKAEYARFSDRLGVEGIEFRKMVPHLWLPTLLRSLGYETRALVSLPVLNEATPVNMGFDHYELMDRHNDMAAMLDRLSFDGPSFTLLNVGETHYPYALPDEPEDRWPRVSGVHGVIRTLDDGGAPCEPFFDQDRLDELRQRQVQAVRYLDGVTAELLERLPDGTWVIVTSDHGELFGEGDYFGHGPIQHPKVLEVPFVEGRV